VRRGIAPPNQACFGLTRAAAGRAGATGGRRGRRSLPRTAGLAALLAASLLVCASGWAQTNFAELVSDGAWTWFDDPRALFDNGVLYFSYNRAADGAAVLSTLNLQSGAVSNLWTSSLTLVDDHYVPGLLVKQDGTMLAIYSRHENDQFFMYRLSTSPNPLSASSWGPEQTNNTGTTVSTGMTYSNPFQLSSEGGKIYNFARYLNYNPNVFTSTNGGSNWSAPTILIQTGSGSTRPYVKYCSDYNSRLDFLYTDAHPDNYTNSLYHMYYQGGSFYQSDGTFLKSYADLPILHDDGERGTVIYQYSEAAQPDPNQWIPYGRAWCWEIAYRTNGYPVCVFQTKVDNVTGTNWYDARIYYYYASWTGTNWQKRFIAQAGRPLYNGQPDYGGGIGLDPLNVGTVYLASDAASPFNLTTTTNVALGNHYEIYKGVTGDGGLTFTWQAVTTNSAVDNLRPYVPRRFGGEPCVLWFLGTYTSYTSFSTAVVGLFTTQIPQTNAASGFWNADADGSWGDYSKWLNGIIAFGAGNAADFSTVSLSSNRTVTLDAPRSIGTLKFGDPGGAQNWLVNSSGGSVLTLNTGSSASPAIAVTNTATLQVPLAGTNGFTKSGPGTVILAASNSLSGTLYLDSSSTSANDGAVQITSSTALGTVASPVYFRNNTGGQAVGSLQLNATQGGIIVTQNFSTTCRNNNTTPTFESVAGTNTLAGTNFCQVGGTNVIYQADAGSSLLITAPMQYVGTLTAGRTFTFTGVGNLAVNGALLAASNGAPVSVIKTGAGTLTFSGANTYTNGTLVLGGALNDNSSLGGGPVTVTGGTLGGTGAISGPVTIQAGGTLAPGNNSSGALTINNALTNAGTLFFQLNKSGATRTNTALTGISTLALGGSLSLTNLGTGIVTAGDSFKLFSATKVTGSLAAILPAAPGPGLKWNTNGLASGILAAALGVVRPQITQTLLSGSSLVCSGGGGAAGYSYSVLTSTNLTAPLSSWSLAQTGNFDAAGNFIFSNTINSKTPASFYAIQIH
jgi:autotransporter-associated beta strand protein